MLSLNNAKPEQALFWRNLPGRVSFHNFWQIEINNWLTEDFECYYQSLFMLCKSGLLLCFLCIRSCSWVNLHCSAQKQFVSLSPQLDSWWPGAKIMFTPQIKMDFVSCFVSTYVTHYYIYSTVNSRNSHPKISKVLVDLPHWYINQRKYLEYVFSKRWWIFLRFINPLKLQWRSEGAVSNVFFPYCYCFC